MIFIESEIWSVSIFWKKRNEIASLWRLLNIFKQSANCLFEVNLFKSKSEVYLSFVPIPAPNFPKYPDFLPSFKTRLIIFLFSPSFIPVVLVSSLSSSIIWTLLIASAFKFWRAIVWSLLKNSLPSTNILVTSSPWALTFPSVPIWIPGNFLIKSPTLSSCLTLNAFVLKAMVSCLIFIGTIAFIVTSSNWFTSFLI